MTGLWGNGQFDAGKIRSIRRDLACIQVLLKIVAQIHRRIVMREIIVAAALVLALAAPPAGAATCADTGNRAGCVGPNGAAVYNKNTGTVHKTQPNRYNRVAPGTHVQGARGNKGTKALAPGCAYVNGRRVCK